MENEIRLAKNGQTPGTLPPASRGGRRTGAGRKVIGVTRKLSLTLPDNIWAEIDRRAPPSDYQAESVPPSFFRDVHLDKMIRDMVRGTEEYELEPLFYDKLEDLDCIRYRLEMMREIDNRGLLEAFEVFSERMRKAREYEKYSRSSEDQDQRMKWLLDAATFYSFATRELHCMLTNVRLQSQGLVRFHEWLTYYSQSPCFAALNKEATELHREFSLIRFDMTLENGKMTISPIDDEQDYFPFPSDQRAKLRLPVVQRGERNPYQRRL